MNIDKIKPLIEMLLAKEKLSLYDVKLDFEGGEHYLRVFVDKDEGRLTLDEIVDVREKISHELDQIDGDNQAFILDVSSAGAEKEIKFNRLAKYIDHYIKVTLVQAYKENHELKGYLISVDQASLVVEVNNKGRMSKVTVEFSNIAKINQAIKI